MKRIFCLILCILLLGGCTSRNEQDNTAFYYCQDSTPNGRQASLVVPEYRDLSVNTLDLKNVLALYLIGPQDEMLYSPFRGMKLISVESDHATLLIELSCNDRSLTDARFSLACACITMTCLELTDSEQVRISCGNRTVTMSRDNLLLEDNVIPTETNLEEIQ